MHCDDSIMLMGLLCQVWSRAGHCAHSLVGVGVNTRGVARYFFFRSILMERHFDTFASEVWQNILLKSNLPKKVLKI